MWWSIQEQQLLLSVVTHMCVRTLIFLVEVKMTATVVAFHFYKILIMDHGQHF